MSGTVLGAGMVFERDTKPASGWRLWLTCPGSLLYVAKITHGYILSGAREHGAVVALHPVWLLGET